MTDNIRTLTMDRELNDQISNNCYDALCQVGYNDPFELDDLDGIDLEVEAMILSALLQ